MPKSQPVILEVAGREVTITNPDKVYFPQAGHTKLDLVRYYLAVAEGALRGIAGRPIVLKRYVDGAEGQPFFQKRAPEKRPDWIETVELRFPSGRTAREIVVRDAAQLLWIVEPRLHRPQPAPGARRRPRSSRRAAHRPRPRPGRELGRRPRTWRWWCARCSTSTACAAGRRPRARAASTSTCASSGAGASSRCAARRWRWRARWSARAPEQRHEQVVEGGAPRRLPRLQPERQGPHRRLGLVGAAAAGRARLDAARVGRGRRTAIRRRSRWSPRRRASPSAATPRPGSTTPRARSSRCSRCPRRRRRRGRATRRGRRTTASRSGEPPRVAPSRRKKAAAPRKTRRTAGVRPSR